MKNEKESFQIPNVHKTGIFWPAAVLLVVTTIAVAWVGFPQMSKNPAKQTLLPAAQGNPDRYGTRLNAAEEKLRAWPKERDGIMDRIAQLEKSMIAGVRRARSESTALVEGVKRDVRQSLEASQAKLTGIESNQAEAHEQVARLEQDLAAAKQNLIAMQETNMQLANRLNEIATAQQSTQNQVSGMQNHMQESEYKVDAMSYQLDRRRVDFELLKDRTDEVASGVHLTITKIDVAHQQVDGWLQIVGDGRFVWLHDAGAQRPVSFSSQGDERPYHLVFTRMTDGGATGYLLVPRGPLNTAELR